CDVAVYRAGSYGTPAKGHLWMLRRRADCRAAKVSAPPRYGSIMTAMACWIFLCATTYDGRLSMMFFAAWTGRTNRIAHRRRTAGTPAGFFTIAEMERSRM